MILNVSGRTDIVAFYSKWFINRYKEGFLDVRNPIYPKLVNRIFFKNVDLIVFCTKNPHHIIEFLPKIKEPILFHVTLTPYNKDIEHLVPNKKTIIEDIKKISQIIGVDKIYVRYDPIFLNKKYDLDYHMKAFNKMCDLLEGYVNKIIISFIDDYKNVRKNMNVLEIKNFTQEDFKMLGISFSKIAKDHNMTIQTCSEYNNLEEYGFLVDDCLSKTLAYNLTNKKYPKWHSRNNKYCGCVQMVDIGAYNTCTHFCKYCYANYDEEVIINNKKLHNPNSSLLIGELNSDDEIKIRVK
ncbi:MAG: DUF1848 domain-containing protein [Ruminococcus sp.]|nr:DUF1848 domain-containing protein [Ruminococcus sp.]